MFAVTSQFMSVSGLVKQHILQHKLVGATNSKSLSMISKMMKNRYWKMRLIWNQKWSYLQVAGDVRTRYQKITTWFSIQMEAFFQIALAQLKGRGLIQHLFWNLGAVFLIFQTIITSQGRIMDLSIGCSIFRKVTIKWLSLEEIIHIFWKCLTKWASNIKWIPFKIAALLAQEYQF